MLYKKLFPDGMKQYSEKELWEVYDKVGVEIHSRTLEREINKRIEKAIRKSENHTEFMEKAKDDAILSKLSNEMLQDAWDEFWSRLQDEQIENEVDDFRLKEDDLVK